MCYSDHNPLQCIIPPYVADHLAGSADPKLRRLGQRLISSSATFRAMRNAARLMPALMVTAAPLKRRHRLIYDSKGTASLQHKLVRSEGDPKSTDPAVNEAYDFSGDTYDFYDKVFDRNSLDDNGMTLISNVHVADPDTGEPMDNAFWDGEQMAYGDGSGSGFDRFTKSIDVVGHELTHGVVTFTSNLIYFGQSGALNEHFADVFGVLVGQWVRGETANNGSWLIGADLIQPAPTRRALRDMENPGTAFQGDPLLGDDPQPAHMDDLYTGPRDRNGVHINSGIPNRAFALAAKAIGGKAWDVTGRIWYDTMRKLNKDAKIVDCANQTLADAPDAPARKAVKAAWKKVGITL